MKNFKFNGKLYGINIIYYVDWEIFYKCYYKNDKLEGEFISYYENGKIWYKCYFKNGKKIEI